MNRDMLLKYLESYNSAELFYRSYQEKRKDPEQLQAFLESLDRERTLQKGYMLPEFMPEKIPTQRMNTDDSDGTNQRNVRLIRHNRYAPAFDHNHDFFEIIYVLRGTCEHRIAQQTRLMREGDLCLLSPSSCHSIYAEGDSLIIKILISSNTIENLFSNALQGKDVVSDFLRNAIFLKDYASHLIFHTDGDEEIRDQILDMFMEEFQADEYADRIITNMVMIFFIKIVRKYKRTAESPAPSRPTYSDTSRILQYIQENYATASLAELAEMLNYSVPYCSKYIKSYTGHSFSQLQKRIRFQKATDYLLNTGMSIERISERIGYANPENFMRMFKKEYGISPTQFRSSHRIGPDGD